MIRAQVPGLLEARKWDSVRAILITPPLSDCWGKNARPLLRDFAAALGDSGGDELAALEAREDARVIHATLHAIDLTHTRLRF